MADSLKNVFFNDFGALALRGIGKDYGRLTRKFGIQPPVAPMMSQTYSLIVMNLSEEA